MKNPSQAAIVIKHHETKIKGDLDELVQATDSTGAELEQLLITTVESLGLSMDRCRGLGFDGASTMMGRLKGCADKVMETYPLAR